MLHTQFHLWQLFMPSSSSGSEIPSWPSVRADGAQEATQGRRGEMNWGTKEQGEQSPAEEPIQTSPLFHFQI